MIQFKADTISLDNQKIKGFKEIDLEYWNSPNKFADFIEYIPDLNSIIPAINSKKSSFVNRQAIVNVLLEQHKDLNSEVLNNRINALAQENTFTITSAHQPLLLGGNLYWWYKIIHSISLSLELNKAFPDYNFIAIHYAGTEDHDFDEINHLSVYNKKIEWKNEEAGANGRKTLAGLVDVINEIKNLFQNNTEAIIILDELITHVNESKSYNEFHQKFFYSIFEKYNVIYFNPDDAKVKKLFTRYIQNEFNQNLVKVNSASSIKALHHLGFEAQAYVHEVNVFYLSDQYRSLIQKIDGKYITKDASCQWTEEELHLEISKHPERFSPNVVLRPLFQEYLLPNIIFIGGGAEIAYWMQLKNVFKSVDIPYPILWRRYSAIIYTHQILSRIKDLGFEIKDFQESIEWLFKNYISRNSEFKYQLDSSTGQILNALESHQKLSHGLDKSIENSVVSDLVKLRQTLEHINAKLLKAEKQKHDNTLKKIERIKDQLYPYQNLQERTESGLQYYLQYGDSIVEFLIKNSHSYNKAIGILLRS